MSAAADRLTVGVLGGMGPMATVDAFRRITEATVAVVDQEHLHVVIDSDAAIPDRTKALLNGGPDPRPRLLASADRLVTAGAGVICMPCNTAHAYHPWLQARTAVPIVHMVQETASVVGASGASAVALLATAGTVRTGLYSAALRRVGAAAVTPGAPAQERITAAINLVKAGYDLSAAAALCEEVADELLDQGAQAVLLACTELSLLASRLAVRLAVIDALQVMVDVTVGLATRARSLPTAHAGGTRVP